MTVIASRAYAKTVLQDFTPRMGLRYASDRNYDFGPGKHRAVSQLSPFVRRRLLLESELVSAAIAAHGERDSEKFVQEVVWRGYFKGWMEHRPQVWATYRDELKRDLAILDTDRRLRCAIEDAENGQTGLSCFDAWVMELSDTGYLHNHARMWFASIWIFTLGLPWRIGADFMFRHLLDGDPASNTLGWRWVAGLHTRGKAYEAQAWNIAKFTENRFEPRVGALREGVTGLAHLEPDGLPPLQSLRNVKVPEKGVPSALLITEEDCRVEDFGLAAYDLRTAAILHSSQLRSPRPVSPDVASFEAAALKDAASRAGIKAELLHTTGPDGLVQWAARSGVKQIVTPYIPEGPLRDWIRQAEPCLLAEGITISEWKREWDIAIWPLATAGFFKVKKQIPALVKAFV